MITVSPKGKPDINAIGTISGLLIIKTLDGSKMIGSESLVYLNPATPAADKWFKEVIQKNKSFARAEDDITIKDFPLSEAISQFLSPALPTEVIENEVISNHVLKKSYASPGGDSRKYARIQKTDRDGGFRFDNVAPGRYYITIHMYWIVGPAFLDAEQMQVALPYAVVELKAGEFTQCIVTREEPFKPSLDRHDRRYVAP